jgi:hypothetical protein
MIKNILGRVVANDDLRASGRFQAIFEEISDTPIEVIHTSPGYRLNGGGMFFVPEVDDEVLALYDTTTRKAYYNSTVMDSKNESTRSKPVPNFTEVPDPNTYSTIGKPVKVTYQNQQGAGLSITNENTSYDWMTANTVKPIKIPPRIINSVILNSPLGKKVSLDDSPQVDSLTLRNQHKDGITIVGDGNKQYAGRTIHVKSVGPHLYTCMESHIDFRVVEGTDITIENNSTGTKSASALPQEDWPNGGSNQAPKRWGGIYLKSDNGDISFVSKADDGRVFINTPKSQIQIINGNIVINTEGELSVSAGSDINMKSGGKISIDAAGDVNIKSGGSLKGTATGEAAISGGGDATLKGATVQLNPPGSVSQAGGATVKQTLKNDYND